VRPRACEDAVFLDTIVALSITFGQEATVFKPFFAMKRFLQIPLLCLIASAPLLAEDFVINWKAKQSGAFGSGSHAITEYYSRRYSLTQFQNSNLEDELFDHVDSIMYHIDHGKKIIKKYTLEDAIKYEEALAQAKLEAPDKFDNLGLAMKNFIYTNYMVDATVEAIIGEGNAPTVKKTGTEKVLKRKCDKWKATLGKMSFEVSFDPTLVLPNTNSIEARKTQKMLVSALSKVTLGLADELRKAANNGSPLKVRVKIPVGPKYINSEQEATSIVQGSIPSSVFELPEGYTMEDEGKKKLEALKERLAGIAP
jgi:hypothetical protein